MNIYMSWHKGGTVTRQWPWIHCPNDHSQTFTGFNLFTNHKLAKTA